MKTDLNNMMNINWTDIEKAAKNEAVVLLPLGVIEEHGPHLCTGTDIYTARIYCSLIGEKLAAKNIGSIIAPPFFWGICQSTAGFIGSFAIRKETAMNLVIDILYSLAGFGFREAYGINAHGDIEQHVLFRDSFREVSGKAEIRALYCFPEDRLHFYDLDGSEDYICPVAPSRINASASAEPDIHGGDMETAIMHKFFPDGVKAETAKKLPAVTIALERQMEWLLGGKTKQISPEGYLGNPAKYDEFALDAFLEDIIGRYADAIIANRNSAI